ncbi:hypothetical protein Rsub_12133 [Raphidocelis subcapitata]|uniref:Embryonic stem cell-specific 5-hydroxymethylcytosine-binding protein n=1 Tax=Raphidocelis subcapitata TaxID=307507 RepID=A0A2V0PQH9_9CHLO|nr:hypothetical protein Rsub_12133 [Raphidocelis subcapitata]|eukprot:GBF99465.1 hypothetical protein Rsub_12133 [Raphidocelis subcapitata]
MCGRARAALSPEEVAAASGVSRQALDAGGWVGRGRYVPTVNAQPGAWAPVVRSPRGRTGGGAGGGTGGATGGSQAGGGAGGGTGGATGGSQAGGSGGGSQAGGGGGGGSEEGGGEEGGGDAAPAGGGEEGGGEEGGGRVVECMKWGLVPFFTREDRPDHFKMFNARSETVASKGVFSRLLPGRRCVVLLNGFYEWKAVAGGKKQPYYVHLKSPSGGEEPMRMAGLWDEWTDPEGQKVRSFTMLTTDSAPKLSWLHDRMPALLRGDADVEAWLGPEPNLKVIRPYNGDDLAWHPVTPAMSKPSYQGPDACRDVRQSKGSIHAFFKPKGGGGGAAAAGGNGGKGGAAVDGGGGGESQAVAGAPAGEEGAAAAAAAAAVVKREAHAPPQQTGGGGGDSGGGDGGASGPGAAALNADDNAGPSAADEAAAAKQEAGGKRPGAGPDAGAGAPAEKKPRTAP